MSIPDTGLVSPCGPAHILSERAVRWFHLGGNGYQLWIRFFALFRMNPFGPRKLGRPESPWGSIVSGGRGRHMSSSFLSVYGVFRCILVFRLEEWFEVSVRLVFGRPSRNCFVGVVPDRRSIELDSARNEDESLVSDIHWGG